jgi:hypothetical protein
VVVAYGGRANFSINANITANLVVGAFGGEAAGRGAAGGADPPDPRRHSIGGRRALTTRFQ